jgi:aldehyde oxidoreductase
MLFCKFLLSPLPQARVAHIDASRVLAMPGVNAIITADDVPAGSRTTRDVRLAVLRSST